MKTDEFLKKLNKLEKAMIAAHKEHPPEKNPDKTGGVRDHKIGTSKGCKHCIALGEASNKLYAFEKEHLGVSRMEQATIQNTVLMIKNIILMLKEEEVI